MFYFGKKIVGQLVVVSHELFREKFMCSELQIWILRVQLTFLKLSSDHYY
jgi:hypothetical protein